MVDLGAGLEDLEDYDYAPTTIAGARQRLTLANSALVGAMLSGDPAKALAVRRQIEGLERMVAWMERRAA